MLTIIMKACIIMHNMIIEDERDEDNVQNERSPSSVRVFRNLNDFVFSDVLKRFSDVRDSAQHLQLLHDLIEHLYQKYQEQNQTDFD